MSGIDEDRDISQTPTTTRIPQDFRRPSFSATPTLKKRTTSGVSAIPTPRNFKTSIGPGGMPPSERKMQVDDLGETY
ncbi:uncharacterized protein N7477_003215 [Penicillium maclennaniae]|uniref:uncharacterized protein n=1 Tax=Penicillium maclennaniae TaxID=1343394 RepID=UPI00254098FB|nr:uncharacterized protein N7477_003215 [Penicillium maclennaniae]KAJ5677582.1 hypothetical protein N7477_003215 [Penicillium maclennaniae]